MYQAQELALKTGKAVTFSFKGIPTTLHPDQQEVDDDMVAIRIKDVLIEINKKSNVSI